jgi:tripartite-type tricarboxylate transporter receptor subunit TctC
VTDFSPIAIATRDVLIFTVHPSLPAKSVKDLIALAKARPGQLNYASGGIGGAAHLPVELFNAMAGVNIVHIPYKGLALAITALIGGEVQLLVLDVGLATPHMKSGKLRALAVTSAKPSVLAPGLPTVAASGLPGYEASAVTAIFAPARTPVAIINRLNQEIVRFLRTPEAKEKFLAAGVDTVGSTPDELAAMLKFDIATTAKLIKDAGIKVE